MREQGRCRSRFTCIKGQITKEYYAMLLNWMLSGGQWGTLMGFK